MMSNILLLPRNDLLGVSPNDDLGMEIFFFCYFFKLEDCHLKFAIFFSFFKKGDSNSSLSRVPMSENNHLGGSFQLCRCKGGKYALFWENSLTDLFGLEQAGDLDKLSGG